MASSSHLQCSICPKQPSFSDQSHLLTHISSKGHLSHYFKAQVRSRQDPNARQSLESYDRWYERNGIERLLSQRMASKDSRPVRSQQRNYSRPSPHFAAETIASFSHAYVSNLSMPATAPSQLSESNCIDPVLERIGPYPAPPHRATEANGLMAPSAPMFHDKENHSFSEFSTPTAHLGLHGHVGMVESLQMVKTEPSNDLADTLMATPPYYIPSQRSTQPMRAPIMSHHRHRSSATDGVADEEVNAEYCRLKGIIWPGMDLFDTANQDSKRRRNQKKDHSTLVRLKTDSEAIEPNEVIYFYPSWNLKKSRYISGNVESSPPRDLEPDSKPNIVPSKRLALDDLDPNVNVRGRRSGMRATQKQTVKPRSRRIAKKQQPSSDDEELDLMEPLSQFKSKRGRGFQVYRDSTTGNVTDQVAEQRTAAVRSSPLRKAAVDSRPSVVAGSPFPEPALYSENSLVFPDHFQWDGGFPNTGPYPYSLLAPGYDQQAYPAHDSRGSPDRPEGSKQPEIITPQRLLLQSGIPYDKEARPPLLPLWPLSSNAPLGQSADPSPGSLHFLDYFSSNGQSRLDAINENYAETPMHHQSAPVALASKAQFKSGEDPMADADSSGDETIDLGMSNGDCQTFYA